MHVLVTGGAGFIGSHVAKALKLSGYQPVVLDDLSAGHKWAVQWGPLVVANCGDVANTSAVLRDYNIQGVFHLAADASVGESVEHPQKYFYNNVCNTIGLLTAMNEVGVKQIVFSSTCATYGVAQYNPIDETHPQQPINPYGESKLFIEKVLKWYDGGYGLKSAILRYFNAAGADPDGELWECHTPETHIIPSAIEAALGLRPSLSIFGTDHPTTDGTAIRDYVHVTDLAEAHVLAFEALLRNGENFQANLGTGCGHSVFDIVRAVESATGKVVPTILCPRRPGDPATLVAIATRAERLLGWNPRHSGLLELATTALAARPDGKVRRLVEP